MTPVLSSSDPSIIDPRRDLPKFRPLEAMRRMRMLIANKEDTEQVFHIIAALNGNHLWKEMNAFAASPDGAARMKERRVLAPLLDGERERLRDLPPGTVGRTYVDFMEREGLTAQGLVEESEKVFPSDYGDLAEWFGNRKRDTHDLFHVLSGYGRDALGEASLLAFTYGQSGGGRGAIFIAYMGCRQVKKAAPPGVDVMACFHEGRRNGAAAGKIIEQDIPALLDEPLDEARARLNIAKPVAYLRARDAFVQAGLPDDVVAAA